MLFTTFDSIIGFDTSTPINCQVSLVFYVRPVILSDQLCSHFQGLGHCWACECLLLYAHATTSNAPIYVLRSLVTSLLLLRRC